MTYRTILIDPPWPERMSGHYALPRHSSGAVLPYPTLTLPEIERLPVGDLAADGAHCWLWTTNRHLEAGFRVLRAWGFTYLCPITWVKPSGLGNWFVSRTQVLLFGYRGRCRFPLARFRPNVLFAPARRHSQKPEASYDLIEAVSPAPRLELFARAKRPGWSAWGNEVDSDIDLVIARTGGYWLS